MPQDLELPGELSETQDSSCDTRPQTERKAVGQCRNQAKAKTRKKRKKTDEQPEAEQGEFQILINFRSNKIFPSHNLQLKFKEEERSDKHRVVE